ncbi:MAG: cell division protein CrgA [Acidimicrobiia bacterium]|nr:cell division protein CrgA [Acidimicrobiia bacterium]
MAKRDGRRRPSRTDQVAEAQETSDKHPESPTWYVATMFGLMGVGLLVIVLNYIGALPGAFASAYLYTGLAGIGAGFMMTLNYH